MPRTKAMFYAYTGIFLIVTFVSMLVGIICMLPFVMIVDIVFYTSLAFVVASFVYVIFNVLYEKEREA